MTSFLSRESLEHGWSAASVRTSDWAHPVDGVSLLAVYAGDLFSRCRAIALVLPPDAVFTHVTSAQLRGWRLPHLPDAPIIACTDGDAPHHDRRGVYVRRCAIPAGQRTCLGDLRVASAAWTIVELAEHLHVIDLVVVIDGALHAGDVTVDEIRATMVKGRRGVRALRRALDLCDGRSESAWETVLRLLYVFAGIRVEPQFVVTDAFGQFVARGDLRVSGTRRLAEYDGGQHRDREQHERDLAREKAIIRAGYDRFGYIRAEILNHPSRIVRDAEEALGRPHDPSRLGPWQDAVAAASLSARGWGALRARLRRFARGTAPRRGEA